MALFWLGFFALVALLLVLDLGVLHRKPIAPTVRSAAAWTAGWVVLGLSFAGVVYLIYENNWGGAHLRGCPPGHADGANAAITYVSAYLLEQALSVDNIFVMVLVFGKFKVPPHYQHRVLFWGILGAIGFRTSMLGGGAFLVNQFDWLFYVFGAFLVYQGVKLLSENDEDDPDPERLWAVRTLRRYVRIVGGDHGGAFSVRNDGRRALTIIAVCLIVIEVMDIIFALDSIPAVLSVSQETFIVITSNIFAVLGLRSLYFVVASAMKKFKYLEYALGVLLIGIGAKMLAHEVYTMPHWLSLVIIAAILTIGVVASLVAGPEEPPPDPGTSLG